MTRTHQASLRDVAASLQHGDPVIFPTDTLFGLGVSVQHAKSPQALYDIKQRESRKPIAWLVGDVADLDVYGSAVSSAARALARMFWPGPLTLIVQASAEVPAAFRSDAGTIGLRMPAHDGALDLIRAVGCPLATTSANLSGHANAASIEAIDKQVLAQVAAVLSGDCATNALASTVVDCTRETLVIVREGTLTRADIQAAVPNTSVEVRS